MPDSAVDGPGDDWCDDDRGLESELESTDDQSEAGCYSVGEHAARSGLGASDVDFSDGDDIVIVASTAPRISPANPCQKLLASPDPRPRSLETNRLPCNASAPHTPAAARPGMLAVRADGTTVSAVEMLRTVLKHQADTDLFRSSSFGEASDAKAVAMPAPGVCVW